MKPTRGWRRLPTFGRLLFAVLRTPVLITLAAVGNLFLLLCAGLFYYFEFGTNPSVARPFDALWWAFSTVTTVGFGDIVPVTTAGRLVAIALMVIGVITFVSFTALLVAIATARATDEIIGLEIRETKDIELIASSLKVVELKITAIERQLSQRQ